MRPTGATLAVAFLAGSCGGSVVVDPGGSGASGGGTTTTSSSSTTVTTTSCDALLADLAAKISAAAACDPTIDSIQCDGSAIVSDACSCQVLANENNVDAVAAAHAAFQAAGNCLNTCDAPCAGAGPGYCEPLPNGGGVCVPAFF